MSLAHAYDRWANLFDQRSAAYSAARDGRLDWTDYERIERRFRSAEADYEAALEGR